MTNTYIYQKSEHRVRQKPEMEKPDEKTIDIQGKTKTDWHRYLEHLASLKSYPAPHGFTEDGRELREGIDFEIKYDNTHWTNDHTIAIPIPPKEGAGEDMKNEIEKLIRTAFADKAFNRNNYEQIVSDLTASIYKLFQP